MTPFTLFATARFFPSLLIHPLNWPQAFLDLRCNTHISTTVFLSGLGSDHFALSALALVADRWDRLRIPRRLLIIFAA